MSREGESWENGAFRVPSRTREPIQETFIQETCDKPEVGKCKQEAGFTLSSLTGGFIGGAIATEFMSGVATAARQRKVEAEQFVMVDGDGTERATLQVTASGIAALAMYDGQGHSRAELRVAKDGRASVGLFDQKGLRRVVMAEDSSRAGFAINATNGTQLASLSAAANNESSLTLYDPDTGRARAGLGLTTGGAPALVMFDENGRDRAELHVRKSGNPGLALADESGRTIAGMPEREPTTSASPAAQP